MASEPFCRPLIFVAHPDDETLACSGLLQRFPESLVVFATDGTPAGYGLERKYGSLQAYTGLRFQEAARALSHVPNSTFKWLTGTDGSYFADMHVYEDLPAAATCLRAIAQAFAPDAIVSHTYEGAHIDHDACSFIAMHVAAALSLKRFEFPMYWLDQSGKACLQRFRDGGLRVGARALESTEAQVMKWQLSEAEIECKKKMMEEYRTQRGTVSTFDPRIERFRPATSTSSSFSIPLCRDYLYQNRPPRFYHTRRHRLSAKAILKKFAEFEDWREQQGSWRR
jgi:LmbE family N-acetylglucosaminyl deacetylase